ncbi:MAG: hypothetical protein HGN29_06630 [Asgard group archaeon]|nr:hypothetical protein [Asgard group archaeon]
MIFVLSINYQIRLKAVTIDDFSYSNKLTIGTELSWKLTTFSVEPEESKEEYRFVIKEGQNMIEGDIFKVKILQNLNNLNLDNSRSLYSTDLQWGEFFLNSASLGKNPSEINWYGPAIEIGMIINVPIIPTTLQLSTGEKNYFDYLEEYFEALSEEESEGFSVKNAANSFSMKLKMKGDFSIFANVQFESELETTYNKEWGVLSRYELNEKITKAEETIQAKIVYEIENSEIQVPYSWIYSFVAIFIAGIAVLSKRKKVSNLK